MALKGEGDPEEGHYWEDPAMGAHQPSSLADHTTSRAFPEDQNAQEGW